MTSCLTISIACKRSKLNRAVYELARSTLKENAVETNTLLLIVIVLLLLGGGYYGRKRWF